MTRSKRGDMKHKALQDSFAVNPHPAKVIDELFRKEDFFDPRDMVQVKYEMLRRVRIDGQAIQSAAQAFGLSRPTFYKTQADYDRGGLSGLLPAMRGPRRAHKLSEPVMAFVEAELAANESLRALDLVQLVKERFSVEVHPRSIDRALARRKKNE